MFYIILWFVKYVKKYVKQLCIYSFCYNNFLLIFGFHHSFLCFRIIMSFSSLSTDFLPANSCSLLLASILEKAIGPHSSTLAWKIPWMEEPGRLQSMRLLRVRHDWVTSLSLFTFMHWRRKWQPTPVSCLGNPRDGGAWWAAVYGVTQSRTWLKWLSSSSSIL